VVNDSVVIASGTMGMTSMSIVEDSEAEPSETVIFTIESPTNAVVGSASERTITIVEENVAPEMTLTVSQGSTTGRIVIRHDEYKYFEMEIPSEEGIREIRFPYITYKDFKIWGFTLKVLTDMLNDTIDAEIDLDYPFHSK
jgi:hypothetical protein